MSYMRIFAINKKGDLLEFAVFGNSHRGATLLWDYYSKKFFPNRMYSIICWNEKEQGEFWDLVKNPRLSENEKITLYHTYDRVMVKKKNIPRLIEAFNDIGKRMEDSGHLLNQIPSLKKVIKMNDIIGVCWQQTSISCDAWDDGWVYDSEDDEDGRPFNIFKDKWYSGSPYWLFDNLKEGIH